MSDMVTVMIVDDSREFRETLERRFARNRFKGDIPYRTLAADSARAAMELISQGIGHVDAFLIDIRMENDHAGITLIEYIRRREQFKFSPIVVVTGQPGEYTGDRIEKEHLIHGYIDKSQNVDVLEEVRRIIVQHRIGERGQHSRLREEAEQRMGSCDAISRVLDHVENCARIDQPVIYIDGETGTGKTLVAEYFHNVAGRGGEFIDYNCSTPVGSDENILKSILFGSRKGFLSADHKGNEGLLKQAEGGTLFLDEFQNVGPQVQAMLIKVIENRRYRPLGSQDEEQCNVAFLFAGNRDVKRLVEEGVLRDDFWFRIMDVLRVPPLRERRGDIGHFVAMFLRESNRRLHKYVSVSDAALEVLETYNWPGNVRQLKNVVERAVLHCRGLEIAPADLALDGVSGVAVTGAGVVRSEVDTDDGFFERLEDLVSEYLEMRKDVVGARNPRDRGVLVDFERYRSVLVSRVMDATGGNKKATAQLLGITIEQLATLLKNMDA